MNTIDQTIKIQNSFERILRLLQRTKHIADVLATRDDVSGEIKAWVRDISNGLERSKKEVEELKKQWGQGRQ